MIAVHRAAVLGALAALVWLGLAPPAARAQAPAPSATDASDSTPPKKKGGLFGKAKRFAGSKVVKTVAKVAACTMIPGGQALAGAIDAASAKSAGEAAQGAAGAATGSSCMPGMGGTGLAGAATTAAMAASQPAGPPQGMMPYGAGAGGGAWGGAGLAGSADMAAQSETTDRAMAECLGLSANDYRAMVRPAGSEPRAPTEAETKRASKLSRKVGAKRQAECNQSVGMQQASSQMAGAQQMMAQGQRGTGSAQSAAMAGATTEAPGQMTLLATDPAAELAKGKTAVRQVDWVAGSGAVSPAARAAFGEALGRLGEMMRTTGARYRLDLYMDRRYDEAAAARYGPDRLATAQRALSAGAGPDLVVEPGKVKRDKDPRIEIVRVK